MLKKVLALLLALGLMSGMATGLAEAAEDPVLATVGGESILKSQVDLVLPRLSSYMEEEGDYYYGVNFVVQQTLLDKKVKEMGFDQFSPEEEQVFKAEAQKLWEDGLESYVSYFLSEDTQEARDALLAQATEFYVQQGFSVETLEQNLRQGASFDRMTAHLVGDYQPTEEEIQAVFQDFGASYQQEYENNVVSYEYNTMYNQQPSWYTPEGYRGIIHILLQPDAALMDKYVSLSSALEEQLSDEGSEQTQEAPQAAAEPSAEPVTQAMVDEARQAILDSKKNEIDAVFSRLAAGESFEDLIVELGADPGMQSPQNIENGYSVHRESIMWDPAFTQAAFSDKMQQVGDVSDPVVGSNGIHILKYLRDVPAGLVMTPAIHEEIGDYLRAARENEMFDQAIQSWKQETPVVLMDDAIRAATESAIAAQDLPALEEGELEALPVEAETTPAEPEDTTAP